LKGERSLKRWERIAALVLAVVGIGAAAKARTMGFRTFHHPGPGFFPFWLSAILALASLIYLSTRLGQDREKLSLWESGSWVRPLIAGTVMFVFSLLVGWTGFYSATFFLFTAWLTVIDRGSWLRAGSVSVLGTAGFYLLFGLFLKVPLPRGILF
jgi:hypothetical protein